ncbi:MAG: hypothetical protein U0Q12_25525 [Vicinamibacterales bacterium]
MPHVVVRIPRERELTPSERVLGALRVASTLALSFALLVIFELGVLHVYELMRPSTGVMGVRSCLDGGQVLP